MFILIPIMPVLVYILTDSVEGSFFPIRGRKSKKEGSEAEGGEERTRGIVGHENNQSMLCACMNMNSFYTTNIH